jgi:hypothetical protein
MERSLVDPNPILDTVALHSIGGISAASKLANALCEQLLLDAPTDQVKNNLLGSYGVVATTNLRDPAFKFKTFMVVQPVSVFTLHITSPRFSSVMMFFSTAIFI